MRRQSYGLYIWTTRKSIGSDDTRIDVTITWERALRTALLSLEAIPKRLNTQLTVKGSVVQCVLRISL